MGPRLVSTRHPLPSHDLLDTAGGAIPGWPVPMMKNLGDVVCRLLRIWEGRNSRIKK